MEGRWKAGGRLRKADGRSVDAACGEDSLRRKAVDGRWKAVEARWKFGGRAVEG